MPNYSDRIRLRRSPSPRAQANLTSWELVLATLGVDGSAEFGALCDAVRQHNNHGDGRQFILYCIRRNWLEPVPDMERQKESPKNADEFNDEPPKGRPRLKQSHQLETLIDNGMLTQIDYAAEAARQEAKVKRFFVFVLGASSLLGILALILNPDLTSAQSKFIENTRTTEREFFERNCRLLTVCPEFAKARKSCAAAGNMEQCISVTIDNKNHSGCTSDGGIEDLAQKVAPTTIQCFRHR
jgi:hypothetical protein